MNSSSAGKVSHSSDVEDFLLKIDLSEEFGDTTSL